jgi:hypothetical protein
MEISELEKVKAPFEVIDPNGKTLTVKGFTENDPLGVGGGLFPNMPCAHFERGGWILLKDLLDFYELK